MGLVDVLCSGDFGDCEGDLELFFFVFLFLNCMRFNCNYDVRFFK